MTANETESHQPRILLIEDNPGDVELLRLALETAGIVCDLQVVDDGAEALAVVRKLGRYAHAARPDLAILDLNIPKNDGIEILESMRNSEEYRWVPVVVLSSSSSPRDRAKLARFDVTRYITKPPDLDEFLEIGAEIKRLLAGKSTGGGS